MRAGLGSACGAGMCESGRVAEHEGALTRTCTVHPGRGRGHALLDASDASIHHGMRKRV